MIGADKGYYVAPGKHGEGYDIMKKDGIINPDGSMSPERVCTIYSMEYLDIVLKALQEEDSKSQPEQTHLARRSPIYEV